MSEKKWSELYLRASDEQEMMEALDATELVREDVETGYRVIGGDPFVIRVTVLPTLYEPTGETLIDDEGGEFPELGPIDGYHTNLFVHPDHEAYYRGALVSVLIDPPPTTPIISWRGSSRAVLL